MAAPARPDTARRLWSYVRPLTSLIVVGALTTAIGASLPAAILAFLKQQFDHVDALTGSITAVNGMMLALTALGVLLAAAEFGQMFISDYIGQYLVRDLRRDLFRRMQSLSLSFYDDQSTGLLMSRATNDINVLQNRVNFELARIFSCPVQIVLLVGSILWVSWRLTIVSFVVVGVLIPLVSKASRLMRRHMAELQERLADLSSRLQESIAAIRVVQCFGAGELEIERFDAENAAVRRAAMRAVRVRAYLQPLTHTVGLIGLLLVVWFGAYEVANHRLTSWGQLGLVAAGLQLITQNFKQYGRARLAWTEVVTAADRVFQVIDTESEVVERPDALELDVVEGRVTFEQVHFRYRTGRAVLCGIELELHPGEAVAVVGPSGSGKSTLANLIPRLYDATEGRVLVDGHDVRDVTLASLRRQIGIVPQETVLFRGTIGENIAYGRPQATRDEIREAAIAANADGFIREFPEGYDTLVGERGKTLSGGQAQRVAIARALLRNPRILILDEATSSLDTQNEALVQEALERLMRDRTTLVIAHRLSTIQSCHRIVVLGEGRILESGSHEELLALGGHYRSSYLLQQGDHAA